MDNYLPITEAARIVGIQLQDLDRLIKSRKIKTVTAQNTILLRESDVMALQPESNFSDLAGKPIGIGEAARKYSINQQTLSRWKDKGLIKVITQIGQKILVDESTVARMAAYYSTRPGKGRRTDIDLQK